MLSAHMQEYWHKIGYKPDTDAFNEVDEVIEHKVQVGRKDIETNVFPESNLTSKYHSVILKGFTQGAPKFQMRERPVRETNREISSARADIHNLGVKYDFLQ